MLIWFQPIPKDHATDRYKPFLSTNISDVLEISLTDEFLYQGISTMSIQVPTRPFLEDKKLNKIERNKAAKDGLLVGNEIEEFARVGWEEVDETDLQLRLKWYGMFWRPKTPGKFMSGIMSSASKIMSSASRHYSHSRAHVQDKENEGTSGANGGRMQKPLITMDDAEDEGPGECSQQ